jgi:uncharacterized protein YjiS (DUF1127 family)
MTKTFVLAPNSAQSSTEENGRPWFVEFACRSSHNLMRWLRNRRELLPLDDDQLRDVGLSRAEVTEACRFDLSRL